MSVSRRLVSPSSPLALPIRPAGHLFGTHKVRQYATQTSLGRITPSDKPRHKPVTVFNDDGRVSWGELSPMEKVARTTQQSFNLTLVVGGAALTVSRSSPHCTLVTNSAKIGVALVLYTDVFSSDSSVTHYNEAVDRIRTDPKCIELLGESSQISALGRPTGTNWIRQTPRPYLETDKFGTERMRLRFEIHGPLNRGKVDLYMLRRSDEKHWSYGHLAVDIPGQSRIYLENGNDQGKKKPPGTLFGIRWS